MLSEQRVVQVFFSLAINLRLFITRNSKKRMSVAFTTFVYIAILKRILFVSCLCWLNYCDHGVLGIHT